jgi:hypothetical protein
MFHSEPENHSVILSWRFFSNPQMCQIKMFANICQSLVHQLYSALSLLTSENHYCPLSRKEYIFDITTELENQTKDFYLLFQRTSWIFPLYIEQRSSMYIDVLYHQCVPDYLDGYMVAVPNKTLPHILKVIMKLLTWSRWISLMDRNNLWWIVLFSDDWFKSYNILIYLLLTWRCNIVHWCWIFDNTINNFFKILVLINGNWNEHITLSLCLYIYLFLLCHSWDIWSAMHLLQR